MIKVASYNMRKGIGLDRRRDPGRVLSVLGELDADIVALQEADRRFGTRASAIPPHMFEDHSDYVPVDLLSGRPYAIGWHGNALLVRKGAEVEESHALHLPTLEPRGAVAATIRIGDTRLRVVGMHLDLSGLRRRDQIRAMLRHCAACPTACPTVLMGDFNQWGRGALREFVAPWEALTIGNSFPSRRPLAALDRIVHSGEWACGEVAVHHSALAAVASDHLPVRAVLALDA